MFGLGAIVAFSIRAADRWWAWGVVVASAAVVASAIGALLLAGGFEAPDATVARSVTIAALRIPIAFVASTAGATYTALRLATTGRIGPVLAAIAVTSSSIAMVAAVFRMGEALGVVTTDERGEARPLLQRHGFWVLVAGALLD